MSLRELEAVFPGLGTSFYRVTSPISRIYNCIAWAAGDTGAWWWPDSDPDNDAAYWPPGIERVETLAAFVAGFATLGYLPCQNADLESGFEKVAFFARRDGLPTHAARQLADGRWSSKLGVREDIEHDLQALEGVVYGWVAQILKRPAMVR